MGGCNTSYLGFLGWTLFEECERKTADFRPSKLLPLSPYLEVFAGPFRARFLARPFRSRALTAVEGTS